MLKNIFSPKDFKQRGIEFFLNNLDDIAQIKKIIQQWQNNILSEKIYQLSETQLDMMFVHQIFGEILGYEYQDANRWNIEIKPKTEKDSTRPDASLGFFDTKGNKTVKAIIELKGADINLDKTQLRQKKASPVEQAFGYVPKMAGNCDWVIVSNFLEIRLYHASDSTRYESFEVMNLLEDYELAKFIFLLQKNRLFLEKTQSPIDLLLAERRTFEVEISNEFYFAYEDIRQTLFQNLVQASTLEPKVIFEATQKLIDRIIFMCFVRDTIPMFNVLGKIKESYENLDDLYANQSRFWQDLKGVFRSFDKGFKHTIPHFNGGLFAPDEILDKNLEISDIHLLPLVDFVLKYDFQSELNVNLLGHIFEQSLNKNILLTDQNSPLTTHRKQDGIFYTPDFVTKYITKITIGGYLEEQKEMLLQKYSEENLAFWKEYKQILEKIKILDPACGSGAFLTQVFEFLFDEWKIIRKEVAKLQNKGKTPIKKANAGVFANQNTSQEFQEDWKIKKFIVQNNLFGFDINSQSVHITKLALWLLTANRFITLADLSENILEQNTLVQASTLEPEKNQNSQFTTHSFDIIIGNPPYVRQELLGNEQKKELQKNFPEVYNGIADLYVYFYAQALNLLKNGGFLGFITPNKWLKTKYGQGLRELLQPLKILQITDFFELPVFEDASTEPLIIALKKEKSNEPFAYFPITKKDLVQAWTLEPANDLVQAWTLEPAKMVKASTLEQGKSMKMVKASTLEPAKGVKELLPNFAEKLKNPILIKKENLDKNAWIFADTTTQDKLDKITGKVPVFYQGKTLKIITLNEYTQNGIFYGIKTGLNKAFIIDKITKEKLIKADAKSAELIKPYINATDIKKWHLENKKEWFLIFTRRGTDIEKYPAIKNYLMQFYEDLKPKTSENEEKGRKQGTYKWFEIQDVIDYWQLFEKPKIIYIHTAVNHQFYYDTENFYLNNSTYLISHADLFLSAFLNSSVFEYYKKQVFVAYGNAEEGGRNKLDYNKMVDVPVPVLSVSQKKPFEVLVSKLQTFSASLQKTRESFMKTELLPLLQALTLVTAKASTLELKISKKLSLWYELEWKELLAELKKQKVNPNHKEKKALLEAFESEKEEAKNLVFEIEKAEHELDKMFFEMYGF